MDNPVVVAALVALAGALVANALAVYNAGKRNEHEARVAREARIQQRVETLYVDLIEHARTVEAWAVRQRTRPTFQDSFDPPQLPSDADQRRLLARSDVFASPDVTNLLAEVLMKFYVFGETLTKLERLQREEKPYEHLDSTLIDLRDELQKAVKALVLQCSTELRS